MTDVRVASRGRVAARTAIAVPAVVTLVLTLVVSARVPLWRDEVASLSFARLDAADLPRAVSHVDAVLAPYYALSHAVQLVLPGSFGLRLPSVLAATAATALTAAVARRWWGTGAALVAGLAIALNPLVVTIGSTGRPYALATCAVAGAVYCLDRAVGGAGRAWWVAYACALAAAGLFHLFAPLAAFALLALVPGSRKDRRAWIVSTAAGVLAVVPVAVCSFSQRGQVAWIAEPTVRRAVGTFAGVLFYRFETGPTGFQLVAVVVFGAAAAAAAFFVLRLTGAGRDQQRRRLATAVGMVGLPWLTLLTCSVVAAPVLRTTYLSPCVLGVALTLGALAGSARGRGQLPVEAAPAAVGAPPRQGTTARARSAGAAAGVVVLACAPIVVASLGTVRIASEPWKVDNFPALSAELKSRLAVGDTILLVQQHNEVGVDGAIAAGLGDDALEEELLGQLVDGRQPRYGVRVVDAVDPLRTSVPDTLATDGHSSWLVYTRGAFSPEQFDADTARWGCGPGTGIGPTESFGIMRLTIATCPAPRPAAARAAPGAGQHEPASHPHMPPKPPGPDREAEASRHVGQGDLDPG